MGVGSGVSSIRLSAFNEGAARVPKSGRHAPSTPYYRPADDNYQLIRAETFYESSLPTSSAGRWAVVILYSEAAAEPVVGRLTIKSVVPDPLDVVGVAPRLQTLLTDVHRTAATVILRRLDGAHSHVAFFPNLSFCHTNPPVGVALLLSPPTHSYPRHIPYLSGNLRT